MSGFQNPIPVAVCLVPVVYPDGHVELLGVVRANNPGRGGRALPGGYVDKGDTIEAAATRELEEETGLKVSPEDWMLQHSRITAENRVLVFARLRYAIPVAQIWFDRPPCKEVLKVICLTLEDPLVFETHQEAARRFLTQPGCGLGQGSLIGEAASSLEG